MILLRQFPLAFVALTLAGCSQPSDEAAQDRQPEQAAMLASAKLILSDGAPAGVASLLATDGSVSLEIAASGLEGGEHGFHLHQTGACDAPEFKSAGGHLNPLGKSHGKDSSGGSHLGDLPNLTVGNDGKGELSVPVEGQQSQIIEWLFDEDGAAVVIHAGPDDYKTDPSGDAGKRVACGVFTKIQPAR